MSYKCPEDEVAIKVRVCQQQTNAIDCGVYAVANAFYLLSNVDISSRRLKESAMREHLLQYIKVGKFAEFPQRKPTDIVLYCPERSVKFDIFCIYRLPWVWYHTKNKDLNMAQCDYCEKWFHQQCGNIPDFVFEKKSCSPAH